MKVLYVCRYADPSLVSDGLAEPSHSLTRKVNGMCSLVEEVGLQPYIIAVRLRASKSCSSEVRRIKRRVVLVPATGPRWLGSIGRYLFGMWATAALMRRVAQRHNVKALLWDALPDSIIPAIFSGFIHRGHAVLDVEELLISDPEAHPLFKLFEYLCLKTLRFESVISSFDLSGNLYNLESALVIPGFSTEDREEENAASVLREESLVTASPTRIRIFYGGRLDETRGLNEFLRLAAAALDYQTEGPYAFEFVVTGFCSDSQRMRLVQRLRSLPNVNFVGDVGRQRYLNEICLSDVGFSFLSHQDFKAASFPSKLVEYMSWTPITISNVSLDGDLPGRLLFTNSLDNREQCFELLDSVSNCIAGARVDYAKRQKLSNPFSISAFADGTRDILYRVLA